VRSIELYANSAVPRGKLQSVVMCRCQKFSFSTSYSSH